MLFPNLFEMVSQECGVIFQQYLLSIVVIGIVLAVIILLLIVCINFICCREKKWPEGNLASYKEKWKRIEYLSKKEDTRPLAIINACSLLDQALTTRGFAGEKLDDRLASAHIALGNNCIPSVLRLRNGLAHNVDMMPLDKKITKQNLKIIRQALFDLNVSV